MSRAEQKQITTFAVFHISIEGDKKKKKNTNNIHNIGYKINSGLNMSTMYSIILNRQVLEQWIKERSYYFCESV